MSFDTSPGFPDVYNLKPQNMTHWRRALARVGVGLGVSYGKNARIACYGDSTTYGALSTGPAGFPANTQHDYGWPNLLQQILLARGINAHGNSLCADGNGFQSNHLNDSRIAWTGGWSLTGPTTFGGSCGQTSTTGVASFTPKTPVDTFIVWYSRGGGTMSLDINGAGTTNVSQAGSGITSTTITGTLGINTLNMGYVSGSAINYVAIEAFDSSKTWVDVMNGAQSGSTSAGLTSGAFLSPDLSICEIGINDWDASMALATYKSNVQSWINTAKTTGDAILCTPCPSPTSSNPSITTQMGYVNTLFDLAEANDIPLLDFYGRSQTYAIMAALGTNDSNGVHPNALAYCDNALLVAKALLNV